MNIIRSKREFAECPGTRRAVGALVLRRRMHWVDIQVVL